MGWCSRITSVDREMGPASRHIGPLRKSTGENRPGGGEGKKTYLQCTTVLSSRAALPLPLENQMRGERDGETK